MQEDKFDDTLPQPAENAEKKKPARRGRKPKSLILAEQAEAAATAAAAAESGGDLEAAAVQQAPRTPKKRGRKPKIKIEDSNSVEAGGELNYEQRDLPLVVDSPKAESAGKPAAEDSYEEEETTFDPSKQDDSEDFAYTRSYSDEQPESENSDADEEVLESFSTSDADLVQDGYRNEFRPDEEPSEPQPAADFGAEKSVESEQEGRRGARAGKIAYDASYEQSERQNWRDYSDNKNQQNRGRFQHNQRQQKWQNRSDQNGNNNGRFSGNRNFGRAQQNQNSPQQRGGQNQFQRGQRQNQQQAAGQQNFQRKQQKPKWMLSSERGEADVMNPADLPEWDVLKKEDSIKEYVRENFREGRVLDLSEIYPLSAKELIARKPEFEVLVASYKAQDAIDKERKDAEAKEDAAAVESADNADRAGENVEVSAGIPDSEDKLSSGLGQQAEDSGKTYRPEAFSVRSKSELISEFIRLAREAKMLVKAKGVLDVFENGYGGAVCFAEDSYALKRNCPYVPQGFINKNGLLRGHEVEVLCMPPREGGRESCPIAVELVSVMGRTAEEVKSLTPFTELTPYYPTRRMIMEVDEPRTPENFSMRVVDLLTPVGLGQRALIVAPPRTGKTVLMQGMAKSIRKNTPNAHLIILLVDERPEEVTDFRRTVDAEVIASTFDEDAQSHVHAAEMVISRARRMVECGMDVVILLDSITRLARAYNAMMPNSGKILSGGVEANALQKPKRFFGSARNIEGGGSLTIIGTALIDTGSKMDEVIFEEFKGTGNLELHLDRALVDKRIFPAVNLEKSGTRKEELLYHPDEMSKIYSLRRAMKGVPSTEAMEMLIMRLKKVKTNIEFLMNLNR